MRSHEATTPTTSTPARSATKHRSGAVGNRLTTRSAEGLLALQRAAGNRAVSAVVQREEDEIGAGEQVRSVVSSGGAPLDSALRVRAESYLGADLSHVRVHTDAAAADSARAVQFHAYTSGSDIVFGAGMYDTSSSTGQSRLAHELTHVVQQQRGPVAGRVTAGGLAISNPSDRFEREAEAMGARFAAQPVQRGRAAELSPDR